MRRARNSPDVNRRRVSHFCGFGREFQSHIPTFRELPLNWAEMLLNKNLALPGREFAPRSCAGEPLPCQRVAFRHNRSSIVIARQ
jgi:hypothetical protein